MKITVGYLVAAVLIIGVALPLRATAQANIAANLAQEATEQFLKQTSKEGLHGLSDVGGEAAIKQIFLKAADEGGQPLVQKVSRYGLEDGPLALAVIGRSPAIMVAALDGLAPDIRLAALRAVERDPAVMEPLVEKHGAGAMEVAARHPGVGQEIVEKLGSDGVVLGRELSTDESIVLARHADAIASLPTSARAGVIDRLCKNTGAALDYLEAHPKILLTSAGVATFLSLKAELIGDSSHSGFIERMFDRGLSLATVPTLLFSVTTAFWISLWFVIHLWGKWQRQKIAYDIALKSATSLQDAA